MSDDEVYGVFLMHSGEEYLVAVAHDEESAYAEAERLDEEAFEKAREEYDPREPGYEPVWEDHEGSHRVEAISRELADEAAAQLERGFAVRVE